MDKLNVIRISILLALFYNPSVNARCESTFTSALNQSSSICEVALYSRYYMGFRQDILNDDENLIVRFSNNGGGDPQGAYGLYRNSAGELTIKVLNKNSCLSTTLPRLHADAIWITKSVPHNSSKYCGLIRKPESAIDDTFFSLLEAVAGSSKRYKKSIEVKRLLSGEFVLLATYDSPIDSLSLIHISEPTRPY